MPRMYSEECPEGTEVMDTQVSAFKAAGWTTGAPEVKEEPAKKVADAKPATAAAKAATTKGK